MCRVGERKKGTVMCRERDLCEEDQKMQGGKSAEAAFRGLEGGTGDPKKLSYVLACMALQPKHAWKQSALTQRP